MALIVRDELMNQCVSAGRVVEQNVKARLQRNDGTPLSEEKLEEVFEPVVKFVEERTEVRVRREIDEVAAVMKERKAQDKLDDKRARIKSETDGYVVLTVNGKRKDRITVRKAKRIKRVITEEKLIPEFETAEIKELDADESYSALDEETNLSDYPWEATWDKFCPHLDITVPSVAASLTTTPNLRALGDYICSSMHDRCFSIEKITEMLDKNQYTILDTFREIPAAKELLGKTNKLLQTESISLSELFEFLKEMRNSDNDVSAFIMSVIGHIHSCQKHSQEKVPQLCGAAGCENTVPEEFVTCQECDVKLCNKCNWYNCEAHAETCTAYDCFDQLNTDAKCCHEARCTNYICGECYGLGRHKCEVHRDSGG